jgi:hypothetical protein
MIVTNLTIHSGTMLHTIARQDWGHALINEEANRNLSNKSDYFISKWYQEHLLTVTLAATKLVAINTILSISLNTP